MISKKYIPVLASVAIPTGAAYPVGVATVVDRHIFYNNSYFDGDDPALSVGDFSLLRRTPQLVACTG